MKNEIVVLWESLSDVECNEVSFLIHGSVNSSNFKDSVEILGSMGVVSPTFILNFVSLFFETHIFVIPCRISLVLISLIW